MTDSTVDSRIVVGPGSVLRLHRLLVRESDDDPELAVVGRAALGEFVELPGVCADAIRLLEQGMTVAEVEQRIDAGYDVELDVAELAESLVDLGFVSEVDGRVLPDPAAERPASQLRWLRDRHVRWLFSWPANLLWAGTVLAAAVTWWRSPELLPAAGDFFWTPYVGLAVLVNTALFSVSVSVHELMHLAAARSYGAPARIGFSTRLHHLVVQTDVTAIWALPRGLRYRVYLAGLRWDAFVVCACTLLIAHAGLAAGVERLLAALVLVVLLSMFLQTHVYMRTDPYYVLMEWLRCRNLFGDGLAYVRYLARRALRRRGAAPADPTAELTVRERRGVRIYAVAMASGSVVALTVFAVYGLPILIEGIVGAVTGLVDGAQAGSVWRVVDSALIIAIEGALQVLFLVTFYRRHQHWFTRKR